MLVTASIFRDLQRLCSKWISIKAIYKERGPLFLSKSQPHIRRSRKCIFKQYTSDGGEQHPLTWRGKTN